MTKVEPRLLRGFRDYLPSRMIPRQEMLRKIEATFERFGFAPLMTPALEYFDILGGKYGEEGETLLYRFKDQGERDVALRYDLTVPLARVVAQYPEIRLPFRRYQIAPVWRAEKPARGRFREFVQCDADIVGSHDMVADSELLRLACELLSGLGVRNFAVRINNRKILTGLMVALGIGAGPAEAGVLRTIDKLPKIGEAEVRRLLRDENRLTEGQIEGVLDFLRIRGSPAEVLDGLKSLLGAGAAAGAGELEEVLSILGAGGSGAEAGAGAIEIDLSIARGLDYYTGTIYEAFLTDLPGFGAVLAGGRYDGLIGKFRKEDIPAVGVSLGIDRLFEGLVELKVLEEKGAVSSVLVAVFGKDTAHYAAGVARTLRSSGISCELYPGYAKLDKQFRHAERCGYRWVVVTGPDEAARQAVGVKDLLAPKDDPRKQVTLPLAELPAHLILGARTTAGEAAGR